MKLYRTAAGYVVEWQGRYLTGQNPSWDQLVTKDDLEDYLEIAHP